MQQESRVPWIALGTYDKSGKTDPDRPRSFDQIQEIISMGGNFKSHGNCSPVAEYNYWVDPDAAALVYETAAQKHSLISMVGLDVTRKIVLTPDLLDYMKRLQPEIGSLFRKSQNFYFDFHWEWEHLIGCVDQRSTGSGLFCRPQLMQWDTGIYSSGNAGGFLWDRPLWMPWISTGKEPNAVILTEGGCD